MKKYMLLLMMLLVGLSSHAQSVKWLNSDGGNFTAEIRNLAVDQAGFIYAVGSFSTNLVVNGNPVINRGGNDAFIAKYTPNGNLIWAKSIGGKLEDTGSSLIVDEFYNVYISGQYQDTADFNPGNGTFNMIAQGNNYDIGKIYSILFMN